MVRQARSDVTRQKIIDAAVELFTDVGYDATSLGDIIDRVEVTKGAFYYHFDSKESLAQAIVADGTSALTDAFAGIASAPAPALENIIHGVFVVADLVRADKLAGTAVRLSRALGQFSEASSQAYNAWLQAFSAQTAKAQEQGDLRDSLDPSTVSEFILAAVLGVELLSNATSEGTDLIGRLTHAWEVLLPAIANPETLPYFREYLSRESMRHAKPS
ncbi:MAG: TetR/AcrR family transcriptional regulator [Mycobacteriaceae bacterium]|nr:TetR/AcrR family transcriptional regulator [Mycobacteriaceae bacterium]